MKVIKDIVGAEVNPHMRSHLLRFAGDLAALERRYAVHVGRDALLIAQTEDADCATVIVTLSEVRS